ncbi:MAG: DUF4115 domain-containing protein [Candidatus Omnitrophica bacterium]|nr:DUF4115 domain-containing protein [Candidatus Omnitrophota bacterium]MCM8826119.1 DUF4115 domain-containing protein [Candidatus Omnitrophota bacterium]
MLEELCKKLKKRREELGLDLETIVERTKVYPSVIKAIENGSLNNIINDISPVYLKGFIKIYASFLGVNVDNELEEFFGYKKEKDVNTVTSEKKYELKSKNKQKEKRKIKIKIKINISKMLTSKIIKKITPLILIIGGVIVVIFVVRASISFINKKIVSNRTKEEKIKGKTSTIQEFNHKVSDSRGVESYKLPTKIEETDKNIVVSLKIRRDCFLKVKVDDKVVFEGILKAGSVETWKGTKELEFKISDGSIVDIEVNGQLLPPISKIRKPIKSLKITSQGISVIK